MKTKQNSYRVVVYLPDNVKMYAALGPNDDIILGDAYLPTCAFNKWKAYQIWEEATRQGYIATPELVHTPQTIFADNQ